MVGVWRQGVADGSFLVLDDQVSLKTQASNGEGHSEFFIGLHISAGENHRISGFVRAVRIYSTAVAEFDALNPLL